MNTLRNNERPVTQHGFSLIELLVVIAIIALLAAIIFPVFATIREQTRQSNTMSRMHAIYVGTGLYYADEKRYPDALFGYAEDSSTKRPAASSTDPANILPMDQAKNYFVTSGGDIGANNGYLHSEYVKNLDSFLNTDNLVTNKQAITEVYYPLAISSLLFKTSAPVLVKWRTTQLDISCPIIGDRDLPDPSYATGEESKRFYVMDSMDIGPMLDTNGNAMKNSDGSIMYELHYTPDWTHWLGLGCDKDAMGNPIVTQLKYKNPPHERTIITYSTHHAATSGSPNVIVLLATGTARKISYKQYSQLPLNYGQ